MYISLIEDEMKCFTSRKFTRQEKACFMSKGLKQSPSGKGVMSKGLKQSPSGKGASKAGIEVQQLFLKDCTWYFRARLH
ncbi:hypothetical protein Tco_1095866 [Tanacetum coccineum]